jgi:hypothetical protein
MVNIMGIFLICKYPTKAKWEYFSICKYPTKAKWEQTNKLWLNKVKIVDNINHGSNTLSRFWAHQSWLFLLNAAYLVEKQQHIPISLSFVSPDYLPHSSCARYKADIFIISVEVTCSRHDMSKHVPIFR